MYRHKGGDEIAMPGPLTADVSEDPPTRTRAADRWVAQRLREIDYDLSHPDELTISMNILDRRSTEYQRRLHGG